jgi:DNA-binding NarL/FixJ family response regulator
VTVTRVLIVDDHPLVREGLAARIGSQRDLEVCGEAADVDGALALLDETRPDLMIVDLMLKSGHGLDLINKASRREPPPKMLVLSAHDESMFAARVIRAGAHGYVNKQEAQDKVLDAIAAVLRGELYVSAEFAQRLVGNPLGADAPEARGTERLSDRELEIFELIGRGRSTRSIAAELHLSIHTIETHRENIRAKLSLRNGSELTRFAVQWVLESRSGS